MCLTIKTNETIEEAIQKYKRIATKNIIVYKIFHKKEWNNQYGKGCSYISPYRNYSYRLGYHYYQTGKKFTYTMWCISSILNIFEGLHAYRGINYIRTYYKAALIHKNKYAIIKCIIPKGSEYYVGNAGDIVSDNLILDSVFKKY